MVAVVVLAGVLRGWFCTLLPVNSGDLPRHILYGLFVLKHGLATAGVPLARLDPGLATVSWANAPYNYPPLALFFFVAVAAVSPTLFAAKLALTLIEGVNAWLLARVTGSRWLGVLYWASPVSIWWVSREGQFEPLQALFMLVALLLLRRSKPAAFAALALAVQVKLTALLLAPWFVVKALREEPGVLRASLAAFALALLPTAAASLSYPVVDAIRSTFGTLSYNPYYWNVAARGIFKWNPGWLVACNALATYGAIGFLAWRAWKSREPVAYVGAIGFLVLIKVSTLAQFWYILLFPAFVAPIPEKKVRFWLIALTPLLDVRSLLELLTGPFGWTVRGYYAGLSAFQSLHVR